VAHLDTLPYKEGSPLTTVTKIGIMLVDYSSEEHSSHRDIYMVEVEGEGNEDPNELLGKISVDVVTADAGNENDAERAARKLRNQKRATRTKNAACGLTSVSNSQQLVKGVSKPRSPTSQVSQPY
jgi:hypothetical protein